MRAILRWGLRLSPLAYMAFIWYLSSRPSDAVVRFGRYDGAIKESLHLIEFAILYGLYILALLTYGPLTRRRSRFAALCAIAYGVIDECHQYFVPSRSAEVIDIVKDSIGVCVVWAVVHRACFRNEDSVPGRFLRAVTAALAHNRKK